MVGDTVKRILFYASGACYLTFRKVVKMRRFILGMLFVIILSGCSGIGLAAPTSTDIPDSTTSSRPTFTPDPAQNLTSACFGSSLPTFTDYATWTKVNPRPIQGHSVYVNIYVNDLARDTYISASGKKFPTCATIVKAHLAGANSTEVTALTVMVKMPAGYDPENNDWWWAMYDSTGKLAESSGKLLACSSCHQPAANSDFVFSEKVMEESKP